MEAIGYIKSLNKDTAVVAFRRQSECGHSCSSCGNQCSTDMITAEVKNVLDGKIGDRVKIELNNTSFNKLTFLGYIFPSIMLVLGIILGISMFKQAGYNNYELLGSLLGFIFLGVSYFVSSFVVKRVHKREAYSLKMISIMK